MDKGERCDVIVGNVWEAENGRDVTDKLKQTSFELKRWHQEKFAGMRVEIKLLNMDFMRVQLLPLTNNKLNKEQAVKDKLNRLLEKEELFWKQRSRVNWLKEGDRNTAFFHS